MKCECSTNTCPLRRLFDFCSINKIRIHNKILFNKYRYNIFPLYPKNNGVLCEYVYESETSREKNYCGKFGDFLFFRRRNASLRSVLQRCTCFPKDVMNIVYEYSKQWIMQDICIRKEHRMFHYFEDI